MVWKYEVVLAFVRTGFAGLASYGPSIDFERAIVTMWPRPVPPVEWFFSQFHVQCSKEKCPKSLLCRLPSATSK